MCQPQSRGGRRCPNHQPATIGTSRFITENYGLTKDQVKGTFHSLRAQGVGMPNPTLDQYEHFRQKQLQILSRSHLDDDTKAKIATQLNRRLDESQLPDGATFYAQKKLLARSREQKKEFVALIKNIAQAQNTNRNEARRLFDERYEQLSSIVGVTNPGDTFDRRTLAAAATLMSRNAQTGQRLTSETPRVQRQDVSDRSTWVQEIGYDPDDGRLEVKLQNGSEYTYHNVPRRIHQRLMSENSVGSVLSREVFNHPEFAYENAEAAQRDSTGRWCYECHSYRAVSGHTCIPRNLRSNSAPVAEETTDSEQTPAVEEESNSIPFSDTPEEQETESVAPSDTSETESIEQENTTDFVDEPVTEDSIEIGSPSEELAADEQTRESISYLRSVLGDDSGVEQSLAELEEEVEAETSEPTLSDVEEEAVALEENSELTEEEKNLSFEASLEKLRDSLETEAERVKAEREARAARAEARRAAAAARAGTTRQNLTPTQRKYLLPPEERTHTELLRGQETPSAMRARLKRGEVLELTNTYSERLSTTDPATGYRVSRIARTTQKVTAYIDKTDGHVRIDSDYEIENIPYSYNNDQTTIPLTEEETQGIKRRADNLALDELDPIGYALQKKNSETKIASNLPIRGYTAFSGNPATVSKEGLTIQGHALKSPAQKSVEEMLARDPEVVVPLGYIAYGRNVSYSYNGEEPQTINSRSYDTSQEGFISLDEEGNKYYSVRTWGYRSENSPRKCWRPECQELAPCPTHHREAKLYADVLLTRTGNTTRASSSTSEDTLELPLDEQLSRMEARDHWRNNEEVVQAYNSSYKIGAAEGEGYSANLDKYLEDVKEAKARAASGESAIPFVTENATNGICSRESGRGFGVELEYTLPRGADSRETLQAIARDLHEAGLSDLSYATGYHGYRGDRWHIERDSTVAGEVVSPILYDDEQSWNELKQVCDIIKAHGGTAKTNAAGGHVHMGFKDGADDSAVKASLAHLTAAHQDTIHRIQTNPERKKHRVSEYCAPDSEQSISNKLYRFSSGYGGSNDHYSHMNYGHSGRVEFRGGDGSLDPGHIQAQVMLASALVAKAEEAAGSDLAREQSVKTFSPVGSNAKRWTGLKNYEGNADLEDDVLIVSDHEYRRTIDDLFSTDTARKTMASIAAIIPWQEK